MTHVIYFVTPCQKARRYTIYGLYFFIGYPSNQPHLKKQVKSLAQKNEKLNEKNENLKENNEKLAVENKELTANYNWLLEQLKLSKKKKYGASAEKIAEEYGQVNLFNEAELERQPIHIEPEIEEITYKRKKSKKKTFDEKYGDLPVEEVVYDISEEEKSCEK